MARQLTGNLLDGLGDGETGTLYFEARESNDDSGLVEGSVAEESVEAGAYDITLIDGEYQVKFKNPDSSNSRILGSITISAGAAISLLELLEE